jgi:hypothetical protein
MNYYKVYYDETDNLYYVGFGTPVYKTFHSNIDAGNYKRELGMTNTNLKNYIRFGKFN